MTKRKSKDKKCDDALVSRGDKTASTSGIDGTAESNAEGFPIVGIGASAGGLKAFEEFFSGMPSDSNPDMAFVLVQHLDPNHKSILTELVQRYTRMKVFEVEDGMKVEPNCAYIIPPNREMALFKGELQLLEPSAPRGQRLPINFFFRSLAQDQHERAIGIVLSGTGSDGSLGLRDIKGEGGMVIAQSPESSEYDGMPNNAIATGLVDYILPPARMPAQLIAFTNHRFGLPTRISEGSISKSENAWKKTLLLLHSQTGHDFSDYKPNTILRRIGRRMAVNQIETMDDYVKFQQQSRDEVKALFQDLLIGVTSFFRDPEAFKSLEESALPKLFATKPHGGSIRVWSPGCSTGEEAYSIAILLQERIEALGVNYDVQIFATDIDSRTIDTARAGLYPASIASDLSPERLKRFFTEEPGGESFRVHKRIRDLLIFSEQNVIKDPPFSKLDLISCRNLLIYMGGDLQKKLIPLFHYALNPGGFLFLGTSETVGDFGDLFSVVDRKSKLYQRREGSNVERTLLRVIQPSPFRQVSAAPASGKIKSPAKQPVRELTEQTILQRLSPAAALVNGAGDILYLHGRTGLYLEPAPGETGVNNILKMAREGLRRELTTALRQAEKSGDTVRYQGLRVKSNGDYSLVSLTVLPVVAGADGAINEPLYLVALEKSSSASPKAENARNADAGVENQDSDEATQIAALKQELRLKEEYLQATNEELETSNEELKSSNEEMQSVNEELQSTNEELETSKEELQSVNEELSTVNAELQTKVADLSRTNNDMNNLLAGTGIGTVFVDHGLCIMRFTPTATKMINLISSDVGRPVGHIVSNLLGYDRLVEDVREVLDSLIPKEMEVQSTEGAWYAMRIQPYRTLENVIEGAVITFTDITREKKIQEKLRESETKFRGLFEGAPLAMAILETELDQDGEAGDIIFRAINTAFERETGLQGLNIQGKGLARVFQKVDMKNMLDALGAAASVSEPVTFRLLSVSTQKSYAVTAYPIALNQCAAIFNPEPNSTSQER